MWSLWSDPKYMSISTQGWHLQTHKAIGDTLGECGGACVPQISTPTVEYRAVAWLELKPGSIGGGSGGMITAPVAGHGVQQQQQPGSSMELCLPH